MSNIPEPRHDSNLTRENRRLGITLAIAHVFLLAVMSAIVKWLGDSYHVFQITFFRNTCSFAIVLPMVWYHGGLKSVHTEHKWFHFWRGAVGVTAMLLLFSSYTLLPLADATALGFTAPLFLTVLSSPLLGEKVGRARWVAVLVGFVGAVLMARPSGDVTVTGISIALAAAFMVSLVMLMLRRLNDIEQPITIIFYFSIFATIVTTILAPFVWKTPDTTALAFMAVLGIMGGINQFLLTLAYRFAPAALVVSFNYSSIIWASMLGFMVWGHVPGAHVIVGALVVIGSGLFITIRETRAGKEIRKRIPTA
jgi:drug/metabolite transporter (DMT)-like permease